MKQLVSLTKVIGISLEEFLPKRMLQNATTEAFELTTGNTEIDYYNQFNQKPIQVTKIKQETKLKLCSFHHD